MPISFGHKRPTRRSLSRQLALGKGIHDMTVPPPASPAYSKSRKSPMRSLQNLAASALQKNASASEDYILAALRYASASSYTDYMEKRAFQLPLSWFRGNTMTQLGAVLGGLGLGGRRAHQLHGLAGAPGAAKKVRDMAGETAKAEVKATKGGTKFKPSWEQRVAGRESKFLDAVKGKNFKDAPLDVLKAYLPEVARHGGQGALTGAALGKLGDTLMAMHKRRKVMNLAKKVAVPAAAGLGAYALLS